VRGSACSSARQAVLRGFGSVGMGRQAPPALNVHAPVRVSKRCHGACCEVEGGRVCGVGVASLEVCGSGE